MESNITIIYTYTDSLSNKIVTPTLIDPVNLSTILNNIYKVITKYLSLPSDQNINQEASTLLKEITILYY